MVPGAPAVLTAPLVLASRSPQRRAILEQLGIAFEVRPADVEELDAGEPAAVATANAQRKARAVAAQVGPERLVLGVDTLVALDGEIYGKPADAGQARATLRRLSGRTHQVVSGLALQGPGAPAQAVSVVTDVTFAALSDAAIAWYVATEEWRERAGAYAIQGRGAALVRRIAGDYLNVVGLPAATLLDACPGLLP